MHLLRIFLFCIVALCLAHISFAQNGRRCLTTPAGSTAAFEKWMADELQKRQGQKTGSATTVYTIPVIFHIVHNGQAAGSSYNVSAAQVYAQIDQLNEDFRRVGNGFNSDSRGGDAYIEFCPALVDTNGNDLDEPGIDRINRNSKSWLAPPYGDCGSGYFDPSYIDNTIKPQSIWNPDDYLNIWVLYMDCGILGYAQMPEANAGVVAELPDLNGYGGYAPTDGVVLNFYTLGSVCTPFAGSAPYNLGRTATHEIGHWLGLHHIWGDNYCGTDHCSDTPTHEDFNWGIPVHPKANNCGTSDEMFENFMDYTDDEAMNIFSAGQVNRMRVIMENSPRRASLTSSTVCSATSSNPAVSFNESCLNNSVTLTEGTGNCSSGSYTSTTFKLHISQAPASNVTVRLGYSGTATYGSDFFLNDTLITFSAGTDTSQTVTVNIRKDALIELNESFSLYILSVSGGSAQKAGSRQSVSVSITNDDIAPLTAAGIQQGADTLSGFAAFEFGPNQTIHYRNPVTGSIMMTLTNTSNFNFGCTRVEVTRSGSGASRAWTANPSDYIASKTFRVIPEFNSTTLGNYDVTLYYTEAEIAGWESATGNNRNDLHLVKTSANIAQTDPPSSPEYGVGFRNAFGASGHAITAHYTTGFSSFGIGAYSSLLPVEWVSFDATPDEDHILLTWKTASESAGTQFDIQRSTDPQSGFESIATVGGHGQPNRDAEYQYRDYNAMAGILYYYRILNTDPQGKNRPTEIRMAKLGMPEKTISLYPTIFRESITLKGGAYDGFGRTLQLTDLNGRTLLTESLGPDEFSQTVNTGTLPAGWYIATVTEDGRIVFSQKISKAP